MWVRSLLQVFPPDKALRTPVEPSNYGSKKVEWPLGQTEPQIDEVLASRAKTTFNITTNLKNLENRRAAHRGLCGHCGNSDRSLFEPRMVFGAGDDEDDSEELEYVACLRCGTSNDLQVWNKLVTLDIYDEHQTVIQDSPESQECPLYTFSPCVVCGNSDAHYFQEILDSEGEIAGIQLCTICGNEVLSKMDEPPVNEEEMDTFFGQCEIELMPCLRCGNTDADRFIFEEKQDKIKLVCMECGASPGEEVMQRERNKDFSHSEQDIGSCRKSFSPKHSVFDGSYLRCTCGNQNPNNFILELALDRKHSEMTCLECKSASNHKHKVNLTCSNCGHQDPLKFKYDVTDDNKLKTATCLECETSFDAKEQLHLSNLKIKKSSQTLTGQIRRIPINSTDDLQQGDHITWQKHDGVWHHAIVTEVGSPSGQLTVIGLACTVRCIGSSFASESTTTVVEHRIAIDQANGIHKVAYDLNDSCASEEVLKHSREQLNEYNLSSNNCEHFASYCKTGRKVDPQTEAFEKLREWVRLAVKEGKLRPIVCAELSHFVVKPLSFRAILGTALFEEQLEVLTEGAVPLNCVLRHTPVSAFSAAGMPLPSHFFLCIHALAGTKSMTLKKYISHLQEPPL